MSTSNLPCKGGAGCKNKATKYLPTKRYGIIGYCDHCANSFMQAQMSMPVSLRRQLIKIHS